MNNPWGLSGPQFLWLYVAGFVGATIALVVLRRRARHGSTTASAHDRLTLEETAYLSGGWPRMVEAAIAGLVERNVLRIERNGHIYAVSNPQYGPETELERAIVGSCTAKTGRTIGHIHRRLAGNQIFDATHRSLQARGLAYGGGQVLVAVLPLAALFVVGVARWVNGIDLGYPVGFLTAFLVITLVTIIFGMRSVKPGVTQAGRQAAFQHGTHAGAAGLVAQGGLSAYPDAATAKAFRKARVSTGPYDGGAVVWGGATAASSCGSSSGSSGSSCGSSSSSGSSCGGGGCGGGGSS